MYGSLVPLAFSLSSIVGILAAFAVLALIAYSAIDTYQPPPRAQTLAREEAATAAKAAEKSRCESFLARAAKGHCDVETARRVLAERLKGFPLHDDDHDYASTLVREAEIAVEAGQVLAALLPHDAEKRAK